MKATHNLIICFSHSGNTKKVAEYIEDNINADWLNIEPETSYPTLFQATIDEMSRQNKGKILPPYKKTNLNIQDYKTVFLGYPVWDSRLPPVVRTFLRDQNFNGVSIIPFNTHKGYGTGKSVAEINEFAEGAAVLEVLSINENNIAFAEQVKVWLKKVENKKLMS
nr:flavodoxin [uncultured Chryseobacterium sp.]